MQISEEIFLFRCLSIGSSRTLFISDRDLDLNHDMNLSS